MRKQRYAHLSQTPIQKYMHSHHSSTPLPPSQRKLDIQFHYARCAAWVAVGLRMLRDSSVFQHYVAAGIVLFGAVTTLFPAFAHQWKDKKAYVRVRPLVVLLDNILQVVLGCYTHGHIYPEHAASWRAASPWRALGVTVTGSGVAWLNMSGLLGSLIFRFAMGQQAALAILMLLASPGMCRRSYSLQKGHVAVHSLTKSIARAVLPRAAFSAIPLFAGDGAAPGTPGDAAYALNVCLAYQPLVILVLGLLAPTFYLFWKEMRSRRAFAESWARGVPGVTEVVLNPPPSQLQYFAFAMPAVAALYYYVARGI
jgi:hypothetical protein